MKKEKGFSWKEFWKPSKGKLIIFAVPEVLLLYSYVAYANYVMFACALPCPFLWVFYMRWIKPLIIVIPISIILYLVACLITQIYKRKKKMKKRGISKLVLISSVALLVVLAAFLYLYMSEEKVELTPEEQQKAQSLDLTPKEFKAVQQKTEETFKELIPSQVYDKTALDYTVLDGMILDEEHIQKLKRDYGVEGLKPSSKIIQVEYAHRLPSPTITYLIEDGKVIVIEEDLHPIGP